jgi:hypothetical protein
MDDDKPKMIPIGEYIVGTLVHAGIIKLEDGARAAEIVEEELGVWLSIKKFND